MNVCGIDIKGSEAIVAIASLTEGQLSHVVVETRKIPLANDEESVNVKSFFELVSGFIRDNNIQNIAIKKRSKTGGFSGGSVTFKIEGIVQMLANCDVTLISPQTIKAKVRKHSFLTPQTLKKYQHDAYHTACTALMKE